MASSRKPRSASDPVAGSTSGAGRGSAAHRVLERVRAALGAAMSDFPVIPVGQPTIAIAFSGGVDSAVLLSAAVRTLGRARCVALHIHHGLSPHADRWLAHCQQVAAELEVRCATARLTLQTTRGASLEQSARAARYAALAQLCREHQAAVLLLGHHADDQAETVLLQLLRGAGLPGIAAMPAHDVEAAGLIRIRPLLDLPRATIEAAARDFGVAWIDDESNRDTRFARNALRHDVMPHIERHFPGYRDALARAARHAGAAQRLVEVLAAADFANLVLEPGPPAVLSRAGLLKLGALDAPPREARAVPDGATARMPDVAADRIANLLRHWIRASGMLAPSSARLADITRQLLHARSDAQVAIRHGGHLLRVYRDRVYWDVAPAVVLARDEPTFHYDGQAGWALPRWGGVLRFEPSPPGSASANAVARNALRAAPLQARARRGGERMRCAPGAPRRTLKNLFQEAGVPAWQRQVPLIYLGEQLLYVPHLGLDHRERASSAPWQVDMASDTAAQLVIEPNSKLASRPHSNPVVDSTETVQLIWQAAPGRE